MAKNICYLIVNTRYNEVLAVAEEYDLIVKFLVSHASLCKKCIVREIKKKKFDSAMQKYIDLYLMELDGVVIRYKDLSKFTAAKQNETNSLIHALKGLNNVLSWEGLKNKEKETLSDAIKIMFKYLDNDEKMVKASGTDELFSNIEYTNEPYKFSNIEHTDGLGITSCY